MYKELCDIDKSIEELKNKRSLIISQIGTGMVIRFPGKNTVNGLTAGISDEQKELVFVENATGGNVTLKNVCGWNTRFYLSNSEMSRETVLMFIEDYKGIVLSTGIQDILKKF